MKMAKSLLLGLAAGLVAMTGALAADLPAKAKPVHGAQFSTSFYDIGLNYISDGTMTIGFGGGASDACYLKTADLVAINTFGTARHADFDEGAEFGLTQKLVSASDYVGTPSHGFVNVAAKIDSAGHLAIGC